MPLSPADRLEIHELYSRYAVYFDGGDAQAWADLFSERGRFLVNGQLDVAGRDALAAFARERLAQAPGIRHFITNVVVDDTADGVTGQAYVLVLCKVPGQPLLLRTLGEYEDVLVREGAGWCFQCRRFTPWVLPEEVGRAFAFDILAPA